jgi:hypothetical protein
MGIVRPVNAEVKSGYGTDIFQQQPCRYGLSGDSGSVEGYIVPAAANERLIGTFMGVEFTDVTGRRRVSNYWPASTVGTQIVAYVTTDPTIVYEVQANAALSIDKIGQQYNIDSGTGNTTTGLSNVQLNVASSATNAQLRVINLSNYIDNAWSDAFPIVQVQIAEHQNVADIASY